MAITTSMEDDDQGYVALVPAQAGKRNGCIWHWESNPTKLASFPVTPGCHSTV